MKVIFLLIIMIFVSVSEAQIVYEPLHKDVYEFLARISQKGIIEFNDQIKPLSRLYIAEKLLEAECDKCLTSLENEELEFYKTDYSNEIHFIRGDLLSKKIGFFQRDSKRRSRFFFYNDHLFKVNVSPVLGIKGGIRDGESLTHFWNGINVHGYINNFIGFSFDFRDNTENGKTIDKLKQFTPVTGVNAKSDLNAYNYSKTKMEYSEVKAAVSANWSWGSLTIGKEFFEWGYGAGGKLVLSNKSPSFPFIRLDLKPVRWLNFNYFHAWLSSDVIDSNDVYLTPGGIERFHYRDKYLASHTLTILPFKGLSLSLGESLIYSDKLEVLYLMPVMFFRLADHYISRHNNEAGSNAQFFFAVSSRGHLKNTHLYGTLFIDEITLNGIFDSHEQRNQLGFSLGGSVADLPINNLKLTLEFTRIYPFAYAHYIPTTTYQNASYELGHWMGNNADQVYASLNYHFIRGLQAVIWGQYIRKGEPGIVEEQQYQQPQPPFLFGLRSDFTYLGLSVSYELIHEFFIKGEIQHMKASFEQSDGSYRDDDLTEAYFSVYYGL